MTLYKFGKLNLVQQLLVLELNGVMLDFRDQDEYHIHLYQIDAFYVETFYQIKSFHVEKLNAFKSTHKLKPYLERIDVSILLQ